MAENSMLQEAIQALQNNQRERARDLLTRLLKTDQNNPDYWLWLSAAVDTQKERLYCLQTVLRLDPENAAAKRGLIIAGAMKGDENVAPFPLKRARAWEESLTVSTDEQPREKGLKALVSNPVVRLISLVGIGLLIVGLIALGILAPRTPTAAVRRTSTPGPSPTFSQTPTFLPSNTPVVRSPTPTFIGPTPLVYFLDATYTPTPLYARTPHGGISLDTYRAALSAYSKGDWGLVITLMRQITVDEPGAADAFFFMGEAYRFMGDWRNALTAFDNAIKANSNFAPAYLGRARAVSVLNTRADIGSILDTAISKDPNFYEAYIRRAEYHLERNKPDLAKADMDKALSLTTDSPFIYLYLAQAELLLGNYEAAVAAARTANQLDITLLDSYKTLGQAYYASSDPESAIGALQTYVVYRPEDAAAHLVLGSAYNETDNFQSAITALDQALKIDNRLGDAYLQRGLAYLALGNGELAYRDLNTASRYFPNSFLANIGVGRALLLRDRAGDAYLHFERNSKLAKTDGELAQLYYWKAVSLDKIGNPTAALINWENLLKLPEGAAPTDWVSQAQERVWSVKSPTPSPPSSTVTPSP